MARTDTSQRPTRKGTVPETLPDSMLRIHWDPSKWMGRDLLEAWLDIGSEFQDFLAERIQEDVRTQHRILHCQTPGELHQIQADFLQKAIEDYATETGRMIDLGKRMFTPRE